MRHLILGALLALPTAAHAMPADSSTYAIIPRPVVLTPRSGTFTLTARTVVHADPAFTGVARRFARDVANPTGFDLTVVRRATAGSAAAGGIALVRTPALGAEAYTLDVSATGVVIKASEPAGAFYGLETLKQLLPVAIYRDAPLGNTTWRAAAVGLPA